MIFRPSNRIFPLLFVLSCSTFSVAAQATFSSVAMGTKEEEAQIRKSIGDAEHTAADLDWENVFGVRFTSLKKLQSFVQTRVAKLDTPTIRQDELETKIHFVEPTVAVVDVYSHLVGQKDSFTGQPGADRWIRNTYVVTKSNQQWTVVLQRIADLRSPWYQHLKAFPPAAPVPPAVLESYKGTYESHPDAMFEVLPEGDHLAVKSNGAAGVAIPRSATDFLYFRDSSDPGNNSFWRFSKAADGTISLTSSGAQNDHPTVYKRK